VFDPFVFVVDDLVTVKGPSKDFLLELLGYKNYCTF
jgi:hypothetical protein